jgi:site-specific recombinase XerD
MNVLYLFQEPTGVRVPFFGYNPSLFRRLVLHGGGRWNAKYREFVFDRNFDIEQFNRFLPGIPIVQVRENFPGQLLSTKVLGFLKQSDEVAPNNDSQTKISMPKKIDEINIDEMPNSPFSFPASFSLPEKFSGQYIERLETELRSRKYSPKTRNAYIYYNRLICRTLQKTPEQIRPDDVTQFIADMEKNGEYSASAMNLAISAIKFFFRNVLKNDDISEHHRPRQDGRLPMVLSKEEIVKILSLEKNPKHRLLLMLVYSSGLRVSEVVALKKEHIDISRKVIYIRLGKGRKDRSTLLSEKAAKYIEDYYSFFDIEKWIFPGQPASKHLTIRSAQHIFDKAIRRAGITKEISIHGRRHTFAAHLLESGTDIRYIQTLLGHANLRTTELYPHVARSRVLNIKSPLDTL